MRERLIEQKWMRQLQRGIRKINCIGTSCSDVVHTKLIGNDARKICTAKMNCKINLFGFTAQIFGSK
jgi:uncharacterized protein YcgI (DUF1989 family)